MMSKIEPAKCESMKETPSKFFERALGFVVLVFDLNDTRYFLVILLFLTKSRLRCNRRYECLFFC